MKSSKKVTKKSPAVKVVKIDDKFIEDENDNRVIIFVAIAILVIIGTIIGLLVGCDKKEEEKEPTKPKDNVVVPVEDDKTDDNDKKEETKKTYIRKVTTKETTDENTTDNNDTNNDEEETKYVVSFNILEEDDIYTIEAKNGKVSPYVPYGYDSCKYYSDETLTNEYDFNKEITENTNIYTSCSITTYKIIYDRETSSPKEYLIKEGKVTLSGIELETGFFAGWYTTPDFSGKKVEYLGRNLTKLANEDNEIYLYAKIDEKYEVRYHDRNGGVGLIFTIRSQKNSSITLMKYGTSEELLGYSTSKDSKVIEYNVGEKVTLTGDLDLYQVIGTAKVVYESEGELVTVGMTKEELEDYNLPTPDEVGIKAPTYFVKVDKNSTSGKEVVPDEVKEALEGQIRLSDAKAKAGTDEIIEVGDKVEEKEKVFDGWQTKEVDENGNETLTDVDENYKPEDNTDNELVAKWKEQEKTNETNEENTTNETTELTIEDSKPIEDTVNEPVVETPVVETTIEANL